MRKAKLLSSVSEHVNGIDAQAPVAASPPPRAAWRVDEAAFRLGISRVSIYKLAKEGKLALVKVAGRTLVPESEIVRLTTPPTPPAAQASAA